MCVCAAAAAVWSIILRLNTCIFDYIIYECGSRMQAIVQPSQGCGNGCSVLHTHNSYILYFYTRMNSLLLFLKFHIVWWSSKDGALYRFLRAVHAKHEEEKEIKL